MLCWGTSVYKVLEKCVYTEMLLSWAGLSVDLRFVHRCDPGVALQPWQHCPPQTFTLNTKQAEAEETIKLVQEQAHHPAPPGWWRTLCCTSFLSLTHTTNMKNSNAFLIKATDFFMHLNNVFYNNSFYNNRAALLLHLVQKLNAEFLQIVFYSLNKCVFLTYLQLRSKNTGPLCKMSIKNRKQDN